MRNIIHNISGFHVSDEKALAHAKEVYENSCNIFCHLEKSIKLSCDSNTQDESDEYSSYTNEELIETFEKLERKYAEKRDKREYLEELNKRVVLLREIMDRSDIKNKKMYFKKYRGQEKERVKAIMKYLNNRVVSENVELSKIKNDIKRMAKDDKELDVMECTPNYIDLINRCCREQANHPDKDILEIIKEQQEQIKKENI